jgi:hypothetical protein
MAATRTHMDHRRRRKRGILIHTGMNMDIMRGCRLSRHIIWRMHSFLISYVSLISFISLTFLPPSNVCLHIPLLFCFLIHPAKPHSFRPCRFLPLFDERSLLSSPLTFFYLRSTTSTSTHLNRVPCNRVRTLVR